MDALYALLKGAIDYAGMYPPARLSLSAALANYLDYRQSDEAWMLGTFVVSVDELEMLGTLLAQTNIEQPIPLSVIGRGGTTEALWRENLPEDFERGEAFLRHYGQCAHVQNFEVRLPVVTSWEISPHETSLRQAIAHGFPQTTELTGLVMLAVEELIRFRDAWPQLFFEPPRRGVALSAWYGALAEVATLASRYPDRCGLKLRTGGIEVDAIPSTREVALFLQVCHTFEIRWKGTAGLHQPLRHRDAELGVDLHGFLNLLMASVLMASARFAHSPVLVLSDTDPRHFSFDDRECRWGLTDEQAAANLQDILRARAHGLCSFGSCDFNEPRAQLRQLGWLDSARSA
jgi:hypothetical protein